MNMAYITDTRIAGSSLLAPFRDAFTQLVETAAKRRVYRTTLNELSNLSNRELADLGFSRGQLRSIAYETAYMTKV